MDQQKRREAVALHFLELPKLEQDKYKDEFLVLQPYVLAQLYRARGLDIYNESFNRFMAEKIYKNHELD